MNSIYIKVKRFLIQNKTTVIIGITCTIIGGVFVNPLTHLLFPPTEKERYNQTISEQRPYLSIVGEPKIDSIVCSFDSLDVIKKFNLLNYYFPNIHSHDLSPFIKVYYRLRVTNKGAAVATRVGEAIVDTFDNNFVLRDYLYNRNMIFQESNELFPWMTLPKYDTVEMKFSQVIFNEHRTSGKGYIVLHVLMLYENEDKNLYDTYFVYQFGFNYPYYLITSKRGLIRNLDPAPLYYTSKSYWKKISSENSKIYNYDEAEELFRRINYYYQKQRREENYILGK